MDFISYAQNYEDVMLHRALKDVCKGFYIDVGAQHPVTDSVTNAFYIAGWRGINIEPVNEWYKNLQTCRPEDINLQLGVGAHKGKLDFYEVVGTGLSTSIKDIAQRHVRENGFELKSYQILTETLTNICEQYPQPDIHFLKIDAEGSEKSVLKGLDLEKIRPWIILVEATLPNSQTVKYDDWEPLIIDSGYHFTYFDGLNRFYVADEHQYLDSAFHAPPNVFDQYVRQREVGVLQQLSETKNSLDVFGQQLETAENELGKANNEKVVLEEALGKERNASVESIEKIDELERSSKASYQELQLSKTESTALGKKLESTKSKFTALDKKLESVKSEFTTLAKELKSVKSESTTLAKELESTKSESATLAKQLKSAKTKSTAQVKELKSVKSESTALAKDLQASKAIYGELNKVFQIVWKESTVLKNELNNAKSENESLVEQLRQVITSKNDIEHNNSHLRHEIIDQNNNIQAVYASYSWRTTKVFRVILGGVIKLTNIAHPKKMIIKTTRYFNQSNPMEERPIEVLNAHLKIGNLLGEIKKEVTKQKKLSVVRK